MILMVVVNLRGKEKLVVSGGILSGVVWSDVDETTIFCMGMLGGNKIEE
jgi:hypothetical protein